MLLKFVKYNVSKSSVLTSVLYSFIYFVYIQFFLLKKLKCKQ